MSVFEMTKPAPHLAGLAAFFARHRGTSRNWAIQRATAILALILGVWFIFSVIFLAGATHDTWKVWAAKPLNIVLFIIFLGAAYWHAAIGCHEIVTDYIGDSEKREKIARASRFMLAAFFALGVLGMLLLAFGN
ncbi:MAG: succinate dehydrogenase, hydrophobic membrane anchor protein [Alphaproteobacteria bacterium]|nr:succinate dehydrogenase, hydrophobic membrane anchor protein [Alphaproteobacteria bacterium]MDA8005674.1 succinate dehydrogenase, hydrophobic membrane anchor protein [Alphaproteobacteria bacterium]